MVTVIITGLFLGLAISSFAVQKIKRDDLGRSVKLRILVDKVMIRAKKKSVTNEWIVKETAEAGFNVFSPRFGYHKLDEVKQVAQWCEYYGIYYMPWMRGTLKAPKDASSQGKRIVWANGNEEPLWSPNADEFWKWTSKYIVEYAKISVEIPSLMGVFLDYENYEAGSDCYKLSYDDLIMGKFAEAKGIELPQLSFKKRKPWLDEQGLHEEFSAFQINHWRKRCRTLREAVDEYNPKFQFCIYPAPGTMFMRVACYSEWATEVAPLILADPHTYGRPSKLFAHAEALEANREKLQYNMKIAEKSGINFIYSGGIDPVVPGADPEFCGKNAVMISELTDGYWVFYEGPKYATTHPEYFKWFTWANKKIVEGALKAWRQPRKMPEDFDLSLTGLGKFGKLIAPHVTGKKIAFPTTCRMRHENTMLLACKAGHRVKVILRNHPFVHYKSSLVWRVNSPQMEEIAANTIPHNGTGAVTFMPKTNGIHLLVASAGTCYYSIVSSNVPIGLYAADGLNLIYRAKCLYFRVPEGVEEFTVTATGRGGETVRVNIYDPDKNRVATGQTTLAQRTIAIKVLVGDHAGKIWFLKTAQAAEGVTEDNSLTLGPKLPPVLSLVPEHVFGMTVNKSTTEENGSKLLPALSKGGEKARQAVCMSNLKQIGLAITMYANDYDGYTPALGVSNYYYGNPAKTWYYSQTCCAFINSSGQKARLALLYSLGYIRDGRVFFCPSDVENVSKDRMIAYMAKGGTGASAAGAISISYMTRDSEDGKGTPIRISEHPTWAIVCDNFNKCVHKNGWNVLYVDGAVKFYTDVAKIQTIMADTSLTTDNRVKQCFEAFTSGR